MTTTLERERPLVLSVRSNHVMRPVIYTAIALHFAWATLLVTASNSSDILSTRGIREAVNGLGQYQTAALLYTVAVAAIVGLVLRDRHRAATLLLPQQLLLFYMSASIIHSVIVGKYADGQYASHTHILADLIVIPILTATHTLAVYALGREQPTMLSMFYPAFTRLQERCDDLTIENETLHDELSFQLGITGGSRVPLDSGARRGIIRPTTRKLDEEGV